MCITNTTTYIMANYFMKEDAPSGGVSIDSGNEVVVVGCNYPEIYLP